MTPAMPPPIAAHLSALLSFSIASFDVIFKYAVWASCLKYKSEYISNTINKCFVIESMGIESIKKTSKVSKVAQVSKVSKASNVSKYESVESIESVGSIKTIERIENIENIEGIESIESIESI